MPIHLTKLVLSTLFIFMSLQCALCYTAKLRGKSRNPPVRRVEQQQVQNLQQPRSESAPHAHTNAHVHDAKDADVFLISVTNQCESQVTIHLRYFDDSMKYTASNSLRFKQEMKFATSRKVTVALVGAELDGQGTRKDVFMTKCASGERGYIRYADGLCYKYHFATDEDLDISCNGMDTSTMSVRGRLRGSDGSTVVEIDPSGSTRMTLI